MLRFKTHSSVDTHPHNTTQLQNQSKTIPKPSMLLFIYIKIQISHKNHSYNYTHKTANSNRPNQFGGKTTRPPPNTKKAITKAISHISTQTLHQPFKLIQAKTQPKSDANRTLASRWISNDPYITTYWLKLEQA